MTKILKFHSGQAALIIVFGLGMMGVLMALTFSFFGPRTIIRHKDLTDSLKAYYAAQSGIDELMLRLRSHHNFGDTWDMQYQFESGAVFYATISGDLNTKIATSTGVFQDFTRQIEVKVASSSSKASFLFAVQSGEGGFEFERNTQVKGMNDQPGNVYSNGDILGENWSSGTIGSRILGDAWAVGKISGLAGDDTGGVYIAGNAQANELIRCKVAGNAQSPVSPTDCSSEGDFNIGDAPQVMPTESLDISFWKQQAEASIWSGDCIIDSKAEPSDCSDEEKQLGPVKIEGNLIISSNSDITLKGTVWVEGDLAINSNTDIHIHESLGSEGVVVVVDYPSDRLGRGKIETESNVEFFQTSSGGPVVFVSTNTEDNCLSSPAISVASNTSTVVFSAPDGCIFFRSNSFVRGALAKKIHLSGNSIIEYDPRLATVILKTGLGGWAVTSFKETKE